MALILLGMYHGGDLDLAPVTDVLIRGFQPIGSYHRQLSNAARATAT